MLSLEATIGKSRLYSEFYLVTAFSRRKKFGLRHNLANQIGKLLLPITVVGVATRTMNDHIARHRWDVSIRVRL